MKTIASLLLCVLFVQCSIDKTIAPITNSENDILSEFKELNNAHKLIIANDSEPGDRLLLCLTFVNKADKKLLSNQRVSFYHTTEKGEYEPTIINDESTARLSGDVTTNNRGRIFIKTILPGDYGSSENNRHIHTTVHNAKPEAYDINFKQYTGRMGKSFINGSDQHFLTELKTTTKGTLVCFLTIEVKNPISNGL